MILYHFHTSPFARRVRLVMAMKGLEAEFRDPRNDAQWWPVLRALTPCQTVPTLVDGDRVLTDSLPIIEYLEQRVPSPTVWPDDRAEALEYVRLADRVCDTLIDLGQHYYPANEPGRSKMLGRVQGTLDYIAKKIAQRGDADHLVGDRWSLADIATVTLGSWFPGMRQRAATTVITKQIVDLGWTVPPALEQWTNARLGRPDVAELLP